MWVPKTWADVANVIGQAESQTLDFKAALSSKNHGRELAKHAAAMAANGGGVILIGVRENKTTLEAEAIEPVKLDGTPEKIQQVIGSYASPAVRVRVSAISEKQGDANGVVVVEVPPSRNGPHMVDESYPIRRNATTEFMTEAEVARAYQARAQLAGPSPTVSDLFGSELASIRSGWSMDPNQRGQGLLALVIKPRFAYRHPEWPQLRPALDKATHTARNSVSDLPLVLDQAYDWTPDDTRGWSLGGLPTPYTATEEWGALTLVGYDGLIVCICSMALCVSDEGEQMSKMCAYENRVVAETKAALELVSAWLAEQDDVGPIDAGLRLAGYGGAVSYATTRGRKQLVEQQGAGNGATFRIATTTDSRQIVDNPASIAYQLLAPWLLALAPEADLWGRYGAEPTPAAPS